jgi:nucleoside-diphosphate-sugar epimerase
MPFGSIDNRRSLLFLGNLVDAIRVCIERPGAANKTYLLADGEDVSTPDLVRRLARAMNRPARLLPVPPALLTAAGNLLGRRDEVARLLGSLTLDSSAIRRDLGWTPPYTLDDGLRVTVSELA